MSLKQRLDAVIDAALGNRIVGCLVQVSERGKPLFARSAGYADREARTPVQEDTIFRLASVTKPIVAAAALRMVDSGLLSLDDPVTRYLPFFTPRAPDGSTPSILVRQLLTHTSGLTYDDVPPDVSTGSDNRDLIPLDDNLRRLARAPLSFVPGAKWQYGMSIDVLGGILGAINGNVSDVQAVVDRYVTGPLGMKDTRFGVSDPSRIAYPYADGRPPIRMSEPQRIDDDNGRTSYWSPGRIFRADAPQCSGSAMAGTAGDFMTLLNALRSDFLRPATRDMAFANQIGPLFRPGFPGQKFSFLGAYIDDPVSGWPIEGMIHWGGTWGNNWIVEPRSGINVVVFTNTLREGCDGPFRDEIRDAVFG